MGQDSGGDVRPSWQREHIVEMLRRTGYPREADEASRTLPEAVSYDRLMRFCREHGLSRDELVSRMGGSS